MASGNGSIRRFDGLGGKEKSRCGSQKCLNKFGSAAHDGLNNAQWTMPPLQATEGFKGLVRAAQRQHFTRNTISSDRV
eukprot:scaffold572433_cov26-Prasinocladus_malaysianus.AAC.1